MKVRYIGEKDYIAIDRNKEYEVMSIEKGWYRIITELDEDYLFPPEVFEVVSSSKDNVTNSKQYIRKGAFSCNSMLLTNMIKLIIFSIYLNLQLP